MEVTDGLICNLSDLPLYGWLIWQVAYNEIVVVAHLLLSNITYLVRIYAWSSFYQMCKLLLLTLIFYSLTNFVV